MPTIRGRISPAVADGLAFCLFLLVPLVASPRFGDQFTSVKWHLLEVLAVAWFLAERFLGGSSGWPRVGRRASLGLAATGSWVLVGSLPQGLAWAVEPLVARACFMLLTLSSYWCFRRTALRLTTQRAGLAAATAVVVILGLLQMLGADMLPWLTAGDDRSATFGNVNMAAQFLGLALVFLLSGPGSVSVEVLGMASLAYLYLLGSRSVALAVVLALAFLAWTARRRSSGRARTRSVVRAAVGTAVLLPLLTGLGPDPQGLRAGKGLSAARRLAVWADTASLIQDHPAGIGGGSFEQAFIPYALGGRSRPDESLVYRSPHNDYLRLVAEEGIVAAGLLLGLLTLLVVRLHRSPVIDSWRSGPGELLGSVGIFLAVEAFFQFPFEMAFPALTAAVMLGLALACLEPPAPAKETPPEGRRHLPGSIATVLVAAAVLWGLWRVATADYLVVNARGDVEAQERACSLNPRRLEACVDGAYLRMRGGEHQAGRKALVAVLERAPHYFPAIKLLGEDSLAQGDRETACRYLGIYDAMFGGRSSVHERVQRECPPAALEALRATLPIPRYGSFPFTPADASLGAGEARRRYWK